MEEQHLEPPHNDKDSIFDGDDSSDADSSIEITSTFDETENELVRLSTYLQLESDDENEEIEESNPRATVTKDQNSHIRIFNNNIKMKQLNLDQFIKK